MATQLLPDETKTAKLAVDGEGMYNAGEPLKETIRPHPQPAPNHWNEGKQTADFQAHQTQRPACQQGGSLRSLCHRIPRFARTPWLKAKTFSRQELLAAKAREELIQKALVEKQAAVPARCDAAEDSQPAANLCAQAGRLERPGDQRGARRRRSFNP